MQCYGRNPVNGKDKEDTLRSWDEKLLEIMLCFTITVNYDANALRRTSKLLGTAVSAASLPSISNET